MGILTRPKPYPVNSHPHTKAFHASQFYSLTARPNYLLHNTVLSLQMALVESISFETRL